VRTERPSAAAAGPRSQNWANAEAVATLRPKDGVLVLSGYGLRIAIERGHLAVADGIGTDRRAGLLAKAACGPQRLVVLGHAGTVSRETLRVAEGGVPGG
jgi:hypothetical protein